MLPSARNEQLSGASAEPHGTSATTPDRFGCARMQHQWWSKAKDLSMPFVTEPTYGSLFYDKTVIISVFFSQ